MSVILQGVYRRTGYPNTYSVPAPVHGEDPSTPWWYDHIASHMHEFAGAGFKHWQTPPPLMSSALDYPGADGYGVYDHYDLGSKGTPTRFGSAERFQRCCAIGYANGVKPLIDWVPHQVSGGRDGYYNYRSATAKPGRFPKWPSCFRRRFVGDGDGSERGTRVAQDPVAAPWDDFMFGDELCQKNAKPDGYVFRGLVDAGDWLYRRIDAAGCRNDDTKGQVTDLVTRWANSKAMAGKPVIGEYAEGNRDTLAWWVRSTDFRCYTYDFEFKYRVRDMCNNASRFDMRRWQWTGLASLGPQYAACAVTFIENADSDTNGFGAAVFNKRLGYFMLMTMEGWPSVYYRDYSDDPYCYGLGKYIRNFNWIHTYLAGGGTAWRHVDYQFVVYERLGWQAGKPGVLCGANNDTWDPNWKVATVQTDFGPNVHLHDYTGQGDDVRTDGDGRVTIWIPPNDDGAGYVAYAPAGLGRDFERESLYTVQEFEGADDLDIPPAATGVWRLCQRIWVAAGSDVKVNNQSEAPVRIRLWNPSNTERAEGVQGVQMTATEEGWHTIQVRLDGILPSAKPYLIRAHYRAPQTMKGA